MSTWFVKFSGIFTGLLFGAWMYQNGRMFDAESLLKVSIGFATLLGLTHIYGVMKLKQNAGRTLMKCFLLFEAIMWLSYLTRH